MPASIPQRPATVVEAEAATRRGSAHRTNEDAYALCLGGGLFAVADGMGGHRDGDIASGILVALLEQTLDPAAPFEKRIEAATSAIEGASSGLHRESLEQHGGEISGSTVVVLIVGDGHACCLWVGDSRLYLMRAGNLYLLSEDHAGDGGMLTRAVGSAAHVDIDRRIIEHRDGDLFLLCSDGLLKGTVEAEVAQLLAQGGHAPADRLLAKAIAGGSVDDITVVLVWIGKHD